MLRLEVTERFGLRLKQKWFNDMNERIETPVLSTAYADLLC